MPGLAWNRRHKNPVFELQEGVQRTQCPQCINQARHAGQDKPQALGAFVREFDLGRGARGGIRSRGGE
jgi:hypothetical protein